MATQAARMRMRSRGGALALFLALTACNDWELATSPRPDDAVPGRMVGTATVVDAGTLVIDGHTVSLWGIDAPARDAHCVDAAGRTWPCGAQAAAALREWIGTRPVYCDPRAANAGGSNVALCRLNGRDVGKWLVMHGWAHDDYARSGGMYRTLERAAASKRRGLHGDGAHAPEAAAPVVDTVPVD